MSDERKSMSESTIDSIASAVEVLWSWLSAEKPQSPLALLDGRTDAPAPASVIETEGEEVGATDDRQ